MRRFSITSVLLTMRKIFHSASRTKYMVAGALLFLLFALSWPFIAVKSQGGSLTAEDNINRRGGDYKAFDLSQDNWTLCRDACANDGNCQAYTFVRPGVQSPNARCWLKSSVPAGERDNCCISGARGGAVTGTGDGGASAVTAEDNTNRRGGDYQNFDLSQNIWTLCRDACANDGNCKAYTYTRPGVQGPNARCWLKSSAPTGERDNCCISGVRSGGAGGPGGVGPGGNNNVGNFAGGWKAGIDGYSFDMRLRQDGNHVTGDIDASGKIEGDVTGRTLRFRWNNNGTKGSGTLVLNDDGRTFKGFFSNTDDPNNNSRGYWNGTRQ
jgi:hypothetical protein